MTRILDRVAMKATDLWVGFAGKTVLNKVSLELPISKTLVILGPGGSGKTTLLRTLLGQLEGEPLVLGDLEVQPKTVVYCRQKPTFARLTLDGLLRETLRALPGGGRDGDLDLGAIWGAESPVCAWLEERASVPLDQANWEHRQLASTTVALAVAEVEDALLVFDEPTADLTAEAAEWVTRRLEARRARGMGLVVTHDLQVARRIADEALLLVEGQVIEHAETETFFERPQYPRTDYFVRMGS